MSTHRKGKPSGKRHKVYKSTNITVVDGFRDLGSVIGTPSACDKHMESEI